MRQQALSNLQSQKAVPQKQPAQTAADNARWQTEKEKYMALIQQNIRGNWINQFDDALKATLLITVDPQGQVLSVEVLQSSGNAAFDRQSILAVKKSSPLPLPPEKELAKQFQVIKLPFSNREMS